MDTAKFLEKAAAKLNMTLPEALQKIAQSSYYRARWLAPDPNKVRSGKKKRYPKAWWYIEYIKRMPCSVCGSADKIEAVKIRKGAIVGFGSDYRAIPLCKECRENSSTMAYLVCSIVESTQIRLMEIYLRSREGT